MDAVARPHCQEAASTDRVHTRDVHVHAVSLTWDQASLTESKPSDFPVGERSFAAVNAVEGAASDSGVNESLGADGVDSAIVSGDLTHDVDDDSCRTVAEHAEPAVCDRNEGVVSNGLAGVIVRSGRIWDSIVDAVARPRS